MAICRVLVADHSDGGLIWFAFFCCCLFCCVLLVLIPLATFVPVLVTLHQIVQTEAASSQLSVLMWRAFMSHFHMSLNLESRCPVGLAPWGFCHHLCFTWPNRHMWHCISSFCMPEVSVLCDSSLRYFVLLCDSKA